MSVILAWNHPRDPANMLSTPMAAMNNPIIFVMIPNACSPTYLMIREEYLRMTQVMINAAAPYTITVR